MKSRLKTFAVHAIVLLVVLMAISAVAIWLDLGPVARSWALSN
jgi:hypothetical protein